MKKIVFAFAASLLAASAFAATQPAAPAKPASGVSFTTSANAQVPFPAVKDFQAAKTLELDIAKAGLTYQTNLVTCMEAAKVPADIFVCRTKFRDSLTATLTKFVQQGRFEQAYGSTRVVPAGAATAHPASAPALDKPAVAKK
jgi:ABC-type glycerol-3-phosphate transport system substrate-binding protein